MDTILFTPASLIDLLSKIDELKDIDVGISENIDGTIQLQIGSSLYEINTDEALSVSVDDRVVEQVEKENESAYEDLDQDVDVSFDQDETIESGLLKEIAKNLLLGGMIRLSGKLLKE